jgi:RNA polymerase sigma factor (sigma-70 family)
MSANPDLAHDADPMRDDLVTTLVACARNGDEQAWGALVERYAPLIWSICRRYRLDVADEVGQSVWLRLVDQLGRIRDPAALPGWLATTTRRECVRVLRAARGPHTAQYAPDAGNVPDEQAVIAEQEILIAEHHAALREAFSHLPACCQRLIAPAHQRSARAVRRDQRQTRHPGRQHRAGPRPLPGQAAPPPGHRRADQRRPKRGG